MTQQERIEQEARKYCIEMNYILPDDTEYSLEAQTAIAAYKYALSHQWIPVDEELPEDYEKVFFKAVGKNDSVCYGTGYVVKEDWYTDVQRIEQDYFKFKITHWMPIPTLKG